MLSHAAFSCLLLCFLDFGGLCFAQPDQVNSQCVPLEGTSTTTTTVGWPIEASCDDHVYDALGYDYYEAINEDGFIPFVCEIYRDGNKVHSSNGTLFISEYDDELFASNPYRVDALTENVTLEMILIFPTGCGSIQHELIAMDEGFEHENNCPLYRETVEATNSFTSWDLECDTDLVLDCSVGGASLEVPLYLANDSYEITWYRNCKELPSDDYRELERSPNNNINLLSKIEVLGNRSKFAGTFSCKITYKGMSRFVKQYQVCISRQKWVKTSTPTSCASFKTEGSGFIPT